MTIKMKSVQANLSRENEGDWVPIPDLPGVRLKVRGANYTPFVMGVKTLELKWARRFGMNPVPADVVYKANGQLYAQHILLDWEGFDVEYSSETALETLSDPAYRPLHEHIRYAMGVVGQGDDVEFAGQAGKNSEAPSAGS